MQSAFASKCVYCERTLSSRHQYPTMLSSCVMPTRVCVVLHVYVQCGIDQGPVKISLDESTGYIAYTGKVRPSSADM